MVGSSAFCVMPKDRGIPPYRSTLKLTLMGAPPRPGGGGGNGSSPSSPSGGGSSAATQNGMPGGANQPAPPRPSAVQTADQQPGPPRTTTASASDSFLSALERTTARAHYALNSIRIPHDGTSHAPPSISTGHSDS
jgi:hypothetical protein